MKKGMGSYQQIMIREAKMKLINILKDGQWHQYTELKEKSKLSSATLSKHLRELKDARFLEKKVDVKSGKYPYPVFYKIGERANFLKDFSVRVYHAVDEVCESLKETKDQTEYLDILTEYFHNGIPSLLRYKNEQKDLETQDIDFMIHLFTRPLDPAIKNFIDRYGQKERTPRSLEAFERRTR